MFQYKELDTCSHVFLRRIAIAPPLTALYDGPYKVVARSGRVFKVIIKGKVETMTADRVQPAHIECKPENNYTEQHRATPMSKPTASKPPAKISVPRTAVLRARTTTTPKPSKTGVDMKTNLHARSMIQTQEKISTTDQRSDTFEEQSLKPLALYRCRMPRRTFFLVLTGRTKVCEHIHVLLYI